MNRQGAFARAGHSDATTSLRLSVHNGAPSKTLLAQHSPTKPPRHSNDQSNNRGLPMANETFTANQSTILTGDTDVDGVIDPGEIVTTTVTITNNSTTPTPVNATGVQFTEDLSGMTLVDQPGSLDNINVSPIAFDDGGYIAAGNVSFTAAVSVLGQRHRTARPRRSCAQHRHRDPEHRRCLRNEPGRQRHAQRQRHLHVRLGGRLRGHRHLHLHAARHRPRRRRGQCRRPHLRHRHGVDHRRSLGLVHR